MADHSSARQHQQQGETETAASVDVHHGQEHPTVPIYCWTFFWLMVLLVITLVAAIPDLGPLNVVIAMAIAWAKIAIIMVFFMHLKYTTALSRVYACTGLVWLVIMFALIFMDFMTRAWLPR